MTSVIARAGRTPRRDGRSPFRRTSRWGEARFIPTRKSYSPWPRPRSRPRSPPPSDRVQSGRGTPEQVAQLTQALIDAGKLPPALPGSKDTLVGRIHQMQWRYSIGFDCAGYTQQAVAAAAGKTRSDLFPNTLGGAISFARMQKVPVTSARAGDVLVFGPPVNENVGHKMAVFGQAVVSSEQAKAELAGMGAPSDVIDSFAQGGPLHCYQLDSSWGAGKDGDIHGGYRRETALYNESTGMWAYRRSGGTTVDVGALPFQHPIDGVYRPRS